MSLKLRNRFVARKPLSTKERKQIDRSGLLRKAQIITRDEFDSRYRHPSHVYPREPIEVTAEVPLRADMVVDCFRQIRLGIPFDCLTRLRNELRKVPLIFLLGADEFEPSAAFNDYIKRKLLPLQDNALEALLAIGLIPVRFEYNTENDEVYPSIPKPGTYTITIQTTLGKPEYRFYWTPGNCMGALPRYKYVFNEQSCGNQGRWMIEGYVSMDGSMRPATDGTAFTFGTYDPTVAIISDLGFDPAIDGTLGSTMASILSHYINYNDVLREHSIETGYRMAHPPLVTTYSPASDTIAAKKKSEVGHFVGSGVRVADQSVVESATRRTDTYLRDKEGIERQHANLQTLVATQGDSAIASFRSITPGDLKSGGPTRGHVIKLSNTHTINEIALADDRAVASNAGLVPAVRPDLGALTAENKRDIAIAFGLTLSLLSGETPAVKSGTDVAVKTLNTTIESLLKLMADVQTVINDHIFLDRDIFDVLADRVRLKYGQALVGRESLFKDDVEGLQIYASYRFTPLMDVETLKFTHGRGMLPWDAYRSNFLQLAGIDDEMATDGPDPYEGDKGLALDIPDAVKYMAIESAERLQEKQLASAAETQDKQLKSASELQDKQLSSAEKQAEMSAATKVATASSPKKTSSK